MPAKQTRNPKNTIGEWENDGREETQWLCIFVSGIHKIFDPLNNALVHGLAVILFNGCPDFTIFENRNQIPGSLSMRFKMFGLDNMLMIYVQSI